MKKYLSLVMIIALVFCLTGCGDKEADNKKDESSNNTTNETTDNNQEETNKETELTSINDFESEVQKLGIDYEKTDMVASYINAETGIKLKSGDTKLEIYKFDSSSEAYKKAETNQKVTMEGFGDFEAIVKNGYALMIDNNFPQYDKVIEIFNKLK